MPHSWPSSNTAGRGNARTCSATTTTLPRTVLCFLSIMHSLATRKHHFMTSSHATCTAGGHGLYIHGFKVNTALHLISNYEYYEEDGNAKMVTIILPHISTGRLRISIMAGREGFGTAQSSTLGPLLLSHPLRRARHVRRSAARRAHSGAPAAPQWARPRHCRWTAGS